MRLKNNLDVIQLFSDLRSSVVESKGDIVNPRHDNYFDCGMCLVLSLVSDLQIDVKVDLLLWIRVVGGALDQLHCVAIVLGGQGKGVASCIYN